VNLLLFIGVWLRTSGCCPTSREEIEPCIKKSTRQENEEGTAMFDEDVNKLVGTSQSCQLPISHQTIADFAFTKYDWVRKVESMSLGSISS
jgi:hypothetical protein